MREKVTLTKVDEVYLHVSADRGILREMQDHFSFFTEGYQFHPKFKAKAWDGKIRLLNLMNQRIYVGLLDEILEFCRERDYDPVYDYEEFAEAEMSLVEAKAFINSVMEEVTIPDFDLRDYQIETFLHCVRKNRALFLSPTSSGKSWMIYLLVKWYASPTLIIVDSTTAVHQMVQDFVEYGADASDMHKIFGGQEKNVSNRIVVSTWQSLLDMPQKFFDRFEVIVGDEAHHFAATTFTKLMEKIRYARYRFGFTGTIKGSKCNSMVLEGLFGRIKQIVTTKQLMDAGYVAQLDIKCIVFQYDAATKKRMKKSTYQQEMDFLVSSPARNRFIKNLVGGLEGNTLVFFNLVDKHGKVLYNILKDAYPDKKVLFVHGGVDGEIRNDIRAEIENSDNVIAVVSYGTFQTAISIKNIWNMVFASPSKSRIRNLQSIGRGLRMNRKKTRVELFDLADNLIIGTWKNHTIRHFAERINTYSEEKFKPKIYNVKLNEGAPNA